MSETLSELELSQISQLVYLDIIGKNGAGKATDLSIDYKFNGETIELGEVIDYYLGKGNFDGNNEGVEKIKERYANELNGEIEYDQWFRLLESLDQEKYRGWKISNVVSNNTQDQSGFVAMTVGTDAGNVVAYRGSEPIGDPLYRNDWFNNFTTSFINESIQQAEAKAYIEKMIANGDYPTYLTGHSLGGNLALYSSFILPDEYRDKLISATTFNAPGFNSDVLNKYAQQISELNKDGKLLEYRNIDDMVSGLLLNPSEGIYISSMAKNIFGFDPHSMFSFKKDDLNGGLKRSDIQDWNFLPNAIQYITGIAEKQPDGLLETVITQGFDVWNDFSIKKVMDIFGPLRDLLGGIFSEMESDLMDWLGDKWNVMTTAIGNIVSSIASTIKENTLNVMAAVSKFLNDMKHSIQTFLDDVTSFIKTQWNNFTNFLSDRIDDLKGAYDSIKNKAIDFADQVRKTVSKFADDVKEGFKQFVNNAVEEVKTQWGRFTSFLSENVEYLAKEMKLIPTRIQEAVNKEVNRFVELVKPNLEKFMNEVGNFARTQWNRFTTFLSETMDVAGETYTLVSDKLKEFTSNVGKIVSKFADDLKEGLKQVSNQAIEYIKEKVDFWINVKNNVTQKLDTIVGNVKDKVKQMKTDLVDKVNTFKNNVIKELNAKNIKSFVGSIFGTSSGVRGIKIAAQLTKIENLQKSMRKKEEKIRDMVTRILNQASGIASQVSRNYSEHYVQVQLRNLDHVSDTIRSDLKQILKDIDQKAQAIQFSTTKYREIEHNLFRKNYK